MPIPLLNPPTGPTLLPPMPQDPPTLIDVSNVVAYNKQIGVSYEAGIATKNDVGAGAVYQAAIISHNADGAVAPPWFVPALAVGLAAGLAPLTHIAYTTYNLLCGDGCSRPFKVVPSINGDLPTDQPHNLPALLNAGAINALTGQQANDYLVGYNLPVPHAIVQRKKAIRVEIGCMAEV